MNELEKDPPDRVTEQRLSEVSITICGADSISYAFSDSVSTVQDKDDWKARTAAVDGTLVIKTLLRVLAAPVYCKVLGAVFILTAIFDSNKPKCPLKLSQSQKEPM